MAYYSIEKRVRADGIPRYRCTVLVKENGKITYRETKTFSKQQIAKTWGTNQVSKIEQFGLPQKNDITKLNLGDLLRKYQSDPNLGEKAGRTKKYVIQLLIDSDIANIKLSELRTHHVIEHCRQRTAGGTTPATVSHDVSYLRSVLEAARPIYGIDIDDTVIKNARPLLIQMNLIGKSQRRTRRPINDELELLTEKLKQRQSHQSAHIPFVDILNFSILSCMRVGEVCSLRWEDVDRYTKKRIEIAIGTNGEEITCFYSVCDITDQIILEKRTIGSQTLEWWRSQSDLVKNDFVFEHHHIYLKTVLTELRDKIEYWKDTNPDIKFYFRGTDFDPVILKNAFEEYGLPVPWKYYQVRDIRTYIDALIGGNKGKIETHKPSFEMIKHHALYDAMNDAEQMCIACNINKTRFEPNLNH